MPEPKYEPGMEVHVYGVPGVIISVAPPQPGADAPYYVVRTMEPVYKAYRESDLHRLTDD